MKKHKAIFLTLGMGTIWIAPESHSQELDRGQMLYENHCLQCHESEVHIREQRKVRSLKDLEEQVNRWVKELKVAWGDEEIADIARYLNRTVYKFGNEDRDKLEP